MIGVYMVGWGRIAGGMSVYGRVWWAIACPDPPESAKTGGIAMPQPPESAKIGGFGQVPGAAPQPRGQAPQAGGRNLVKIGGYLIILQFGTEIAPSLQWFLVNGSRGVPPGDQFLGPRIPPDSPRGAPRPKSGKSRVSRGRPKSMVFGGMAIWGTAILGYARGVGIMMGYAVGVGTMMGDAMGGIYSGWTLYSVMEHRGTGGARPTGRYIDQ